jgi:hypothetical protein
VPTPGSGSGLPAHAQPGSVDPGRSSAARTVLTDTLMPGTTTPAWVFHQLRELIPVTAAERAHHD